MPNRDPIAGIFHRREPDPEFMHGRSELQDIQIGTQTDPSAFETVTVLPGETVGSAASRLFGANTEVTRGLIQSANTSIGRKINVPRRN